MKRFLLVILLCNCFAVFAQESAIIENLTKHLNYLACDEMEGRKAGSENAKKAAEYVFNQFTEIGLQTKMEPFSHGKYQNVVGEIPSKNGKYVLVGAHFDGVGNQFKKTYNAADDNASGTSTLIEIARLLYTQKDSLEYGMIFVAYDGEEQGLYGSKYNASQLEKNDNNIALMISIDMVGHLEHEGRLIYEGTATFQNGEELLKQSKVPGCAVRMYPVATSNGALTDTYFYDQKGIPVLNVLTGEETSNFHTTEDTIESLDIEGMALVTEQITLFIQNVQGKVVPTGVSLYKEKKVYVGIDLINKGSNANSEDSIGLFGMLPVGNALFLGNVFIKPEVCYTIRTTYFEGERIHFSGLTAPLLFTSSMKAFGTEIQTDLGPYYSILWDEDSNRLQEIGIKFSALFKVYDSPTGFMNYFGVGYEIMDGFPQVFKNNDYPIKGSSSFGLRLVWFFN